MKTNHKLILLLLLLVIGKNCFPQNAKPKGYAVNTQTELYDWDIHYKNESKIIKDSAKNWFNMLHFCLPEVLIKNLIKRYGKYFYRYSYKQLTDSVLREIDSFMDSAYNHNFVSHKTIKITPDSSYFLPKNFMIYQVWDEDLRFYFHNYSIHYRTGNWIGASILDTINPYIDETDNYRVIIPEFEKIRNYILKEKDEEKQIEYLFNFMNVLFLHSADDVYLVRLCDDVSKICVSKNFTLVEKATWLLGCAKMLASKNVKKLSWNISAYLNLAEGYLSIDTGNNELLKTLHYIKFLFINDFYTELASFTSIEVLRSDLDADIQLTKFDILKKLIYTAQAVNHSINISLGDGYLVDDARMFNYALHILFALKLSNDNEIKNQTNCDRYRRILINEVSEVYRIKMDCKKSLKYKTLYLKQIAASNNSKEMATQKQIILQICELYRNRGDFQNAKKILIANNFDSTVYSKQTSFWQPSDVRLFTEKEFDFFYRAFHSHLGKVTIYNGYFMNQWQLHRTILIHYAKYKAKIGDWKSAYNFYIISDSLRLLQESTNYQFGLIGGSSSKFSFYPKQADFLTTIEKKDSIILNRTTIARIISLILLIVCLIVVWALRERRKAKIAENKAVNEKERAESSEAKEKMTAQTMNQLGHLLPDILADISEKADDENLPLLKDKLSELAFKVRKMHRVSFEGFKNAIEEFNFAMGLINLRYDTTGTKIVSGQESLAKTKLPTFIIFNLIINAFKYGQLHTPIGEKYGELNISCADNGEYFTLTFINDCPANKPKSESGTGLHFMKMALDIKNKKLISTGFEVKEKQGTHLNSFYLQFNIIKYDY